MGEVVRNFYSWEIINLLKLQIMKKILFVILAFVTLTGFSNKEVVAPCNKLATMENEVSSPPRMTAFSDYTITKKEKQEVTISVMITPVADIQMRVEVFYNGKPLGDGERFEKIFDFGFYSLVIKNLVTEDSGDYEIRAYNALGSASIIFKLTVTP